MTFVIAIANEKGGVAKTTTTLSLGAALSENGARVLMIDLDTQANLSLATGLDTEKSDKSISKILLDNQPITSVIRETSYPNLWLVSSSPEMGMAERYLPARSAYEQTLVKAIKEVPFGISIYSSRLPTFPWCSNNQCNGGCGPPAYPYSG